MRPLPQGPPGVEERMGPEPQTGSLPQPMACSLFWTDLED